MTRELAKEVMLKAMVVLGILMVTYPFWLAGLIWLLMKVN